MVYIERAMGYYDSVYDAVFGFLWNSFVCDNVIKQKTVDQSDSTNLSDDPACGLLQRLLVHL